MDNADGKLGLQHALEVAKGTGGARIRENLCNPCHPCAIQTETGNLPTSLDSHLCKLSDTYFKQFEGSNELGS